MGNDLSVFVEGISRPINFTIAGVLNYFPTLYPEDGHFFVGNLEHIYRTIGTRPIRHSGCSSTKPPARLPSWNHCAPAASSSPAATDSRRGDRRLAHRPAAHGLCLASFRWGLSSLRLFPAWRSCCMRSSPLRQRILQFGLLRAIGLSTVQITRRRRLRKTVPRDAGCCGRYTDRRADRGALRTPASDWNGCTRPRRRRLWLPRPGGRL